MIKSAYFTLSTQSSYMVMFWINWRRCHYKLKEPQNNFKGALRVMEKTQFALDTPATLFLGEKNT